MTNTLEISARRARHCCSFRALSAKLSLVVGIFLVCSGCLTSGFEALKRSHSSRDTDISEGKSDESGIVHTSSRIGPQQDAKSPDEKKGEATPPKTLSSTKAEGPKTPEGEKTKPTSIDEKLEQASLAIARILGPVEKIQLCYVKKDHEWWLSIYQDLGYTIDVKQYVWHWEKEEFTPFLVVKRISRSKMDEELKSKDSGRTCRLLPPPPSPPETTKEKAWEHPQRPRR